MKLNFLRFLTWRVKHINSGNFILLLSGVVGVIAGLAAVILKSTVHHLQNLLTTGIPFNFSYLSIFYPLIGILLTAIIARYVFKESLGHGITDILYAISKKSSVVRSVKMYSRMVTSAITVGFGGSLGLESPIAVTGSAIGSNVGRIMHLGYKQKTLLIGCGSAGAVSAIFNSPIAGVIFALEIIIPEIAIPTFIPLLISSVCASLVSHWMLGDGILFSFPHVDNFNTNHVPHYVLLGVACGIVSVYFTRVMYRVEHLIKKVKSFLLRAAIGGIGLGLIIFLFPPIFGEGYGVIKDLLAGSQPQITNNFLSVGSDHKMLLIFFISSIIIVKPIASALTIGAGGSGGIFAPSLFVGALTGYLFVLIIEALSLGDLSASNFTLVGMCGVMTGVLHAPLTGIFLIAEITSGYTLFVPLMLVSAFSYVTISYFEKYSLYTKRLIERGDLILDNKDRELLSRMPLKKLLEKDLMTIEPEATLADLTELVKKSHRNIFPVVNQDNILKGIITLDDIREFMFDENLRETITVQSLMHPPPGEVSSHENMQNVMRKFELTGAWNLPVIDNGQYIGLLSKSRIFNAYRSRLIQQNKE